MQQYNIAVIEKMQNWGPDKEKSKAVLASNESEAIAKAICEIYGPFAALDSERGVIWNHKGESYEKQLTGVVSIEVECQGEPQAPGGEA